MTFTRTVMLEQGDTHWQKIQSIFSAVRMWGAGVHTTSAVQIALALMLTASLPRLWQSDAAFDLKASALATACLLATPYVLDYELVVLAVSIAFSRATDWPMGSAITRSAYWRRPGSCRCSRVASWRDRNPAWPPRDAWIVRRHSVARSFGSRQLDGSYRPIRGSVI